MFITSDQYKDLGFAHLHIPTVDFLFAPSNEDLHLGVDFITGTPFFPICVRQNCLPFHCLCMITAKL